MKWFSTVNVDLRSSFNVVTILPQARSAKSRESNESSPARGRVKQVPPIRQFSPDQVKTGFYKSVRAWSGGTCWRRGRMEVNGEQVDRTPLQVHRWFPSDTLRLVLEATSIENAKIKVVGCSDRRQRVQPLCFQWSPVTKLSYLCKHLISFWL